MKTLKTGTVIAATLLFGLTGCNEDGSDSAYNDVDRNVPAETGHSDGGPQGGHIVEVGDTHAYHAEIAFNAETRDIDVYFYGNEIGSPLPVAASGFEFEMEGEDGSESELESSPVPAEGETSELASHFVIKGENVPESITSEEQLHVHFHVMIDEEEYSAGLEPHDHEGHDADDDESHEEDHDEKEHADGDDNESHEADHDEKEHADGDDDA